MVAQLVALVEQASQGDLHGIVVRPRRAKQMQPLLPGVGADSDAFSDAFQGWLEDLPGTWRRRFSQPVLDVRARWCWAMRLVGGQTEDLTDRPRWDGVGGA